MNSLQGILNQIFSRRTQDHPGTGIIRRVRRTLSKVPFSRAPRHQFTRIRRNLSLNSKCIPIRVVIRRLRRLLSTQRIMVSIILSQRKTLNRSVMVTLTHRAIRGRRRIGRQVRPIFTTCRILRSQLSAKSHLFKRYSTTTHVLRRLLSQVRLLLISRPQFRRVKQGLRTSLVSVNVLQGVTIRPHIFRMKAHSRSRVPI